MKALISAPWWLLCLLLAACARPPDFPAVTAAATDGEERRILVTFVDRSIGRSLPGNPQDRYQSRGLYQSSSWSSRLAGDLAERYQVRFVAEWPVTSIGEACVVYEVPPQQNLAATLARLAKDPTVVSAQTMRTFRVLGQPAPPTLPYNDPYFRLQKDVQAMRIGKAHRIATGRGVRIAVIDTGIDGTHPDLLRQVALSENLAEQTPGEAVDDAHGTAVAGVIAARSDNGIGIVGIAPGAELFGFRACWPEHRGSTAALCNSFTLALAVNEAIRHHADIINLSLVGPEDPLLARLIQYALAQGILIVAADPGTAGSFPARLANVIPVRSIAAGPAALSPPKDVVAAPGSAILTTLPQARYDFMTGSSFAAPHVTGVLALMREVRPKLTGEEAMSVFRTAASKDQPVIDACLALAQLRGSDDCL